MSKNIKFDYFYGNESEQFSYYRIPRLLITGEQFRSLSTDAKLLYGLMLDRMGLSLKHGWYDSRGRAFIYYPLEEIQTALNCGHGKGVRLLAELDADTGIGLIERVKQGQGNPTRIYVKKFTSKTMPQPPIPPSGTGRLRLPGTGSPDFPISEVKTAQNGKSRLPQNGSADFPISEVPYNYSQLEGIYLYPPTNQPNMTTPIDLADQESCRALIKQNISYTAFPSSDRPSVDELVELMTDVLCSQQASFRIGGTQLKSAVVKNRIASIQFQHIEYVLDYMRSNTARVRNIRGYLLSALYNAPTTVEHYYQAAVQHDQYRQQSEQ